MAANPYLVSLEDEVQAIRLAGRVTYGVNRTTAQQVKTLGYEQFVEWQLDYEKIDDSEIEDALHAELPSLSMDAAQIADYVRESDLPGVAQRELMVATVLRQAFSQRQLYQRMVEFWTDHFNVAVNNMVTSTLKPVEDREVIRPLAMGRFADLLLADAASPAMLYYLDNFNNTVSGPNENYSRELMELHTLGVDGGYSEDDVKEAARVFTGWSFRPPGQFVFRRRNHDYGEKQVLGVTFPPGEGRSEGQTLLALLAEHPSTANHLATKLARRFVADEPNPKLVEDVSTAFRESDGDIKSTLRTLLLHEMVREAPAAKLKRPNEFVAGALRGLESSAARGLVREVLSTLDSAGHSPFQWPAPNGYPDVRSYWQSSAGFLVRFNVAVEWTQRVGEGSFLLQQSQGFRNVADQVAFLADSLVPQGIDQRAQAEIITYASGLPRRERSAAIAAMLLAGPENQWR